MPRRNSIVPTSNRVIQLLNEWLERCTLVNFNKNDSIIRYFDVNTNDEELINCIITALEDESYHEKYLEDICQNLFLLYRSRMERFKLLVLNCLPSLAYLHLTKSVKGLNFSQLNSNNLADQSDASPTSTKSSVSLSDRIIRQSDKNLYTFIDTLLLSIYNLQVLNESGHPVVKTFKVPLLARPSIYHEASGLDTNPSQVETITSFGPYFEYEQINSSNRMAILTVLFEVYNQHLTSLVIESLISVCNLCINVLERDKRSRNPKANNQIQIVNSEDGFEEALLKNLSNLNQKSIRINLSSKLMIQLLTSIYFCLFNGVVDLGKKALKLIHNRSTEMMYFDVLLMTNSIMNSTSSFANITKSDDLMGINVILSPTIKSQTSKKAMTIASFKTQIMSEDIPIQSSTSKQVSSDKR